MREREAISNVNEPHHEPAGSGKEFGYSRGEMVGQPVEMLALHKPWDDGQLHETIREGFGAYAHEAEACREMPTCGSKLSCLDQECGMRAQ